MPAQRINQRFWKSTRGRVLLYLRKGTTTVADLAQVLAVTDNAIRAQLVALERDGLVRQSGTQAGIRKPYLTYDLTTEAEQLFPKLYGSILGSLLSVLKGSLSAKKLDDCIRATARQLVLDSFADTPRDRNATLQDRAAAVLRELGGFCEAEVASGKTLFRCTDCPLSAVVTAHPEACRIVETVLSEVLGVPVKERCQPGNPPRCAFEVTAAS